MSDITKIYDMVSDADTSGVEDLIIAFAYEGFNPEMVWQHMKTIRDKKGIADIEFINDMRAIITLGVMKGNYTHRNAAKISDAGRDKADGLYKKYEMKVGSLGGDKKAIILPRVMSAFPELTTKIVLKAPPRDFGEETAFLPLIMKSPVFPTLIPKDLPQDVIDIFIWLYSLYSGYQTMAISQIGNLNDAIAVQRPYITISFNSHVPYGANRTKMFKAQINELVDAVSKSKDITNGDPPRRRVDARETRDAIVALAP
jgi:hypothetical protein